jgi:hypothetical protein
MLRGLQKVRGPSLIWAWNGGLGACWAAALVKRVPVIKAITGRRAMDFRFVKRMGEGLH